MNKIHYCPIGLVQRQFGIYITGAGMETTKPGEPYPHAYHSSDYYFTWRKGRTLAEWEYQILYIRSGEGESIRVCPHVGYGLRPNQSSSMTERSGWQTQHGRTHFGQRRTHYGRDRGGNMQLSL